MGKVKHFIVHARKAVLNAKFSPDMNRRIPPLKYNYVYDLIQEFPDLQVGTFSMFFSMFFFFFSVRVFQERVNDLHEIFSSQNILNLIIIFTKTLDNFILFYVILFYFITKSHGIK